MSNIIPVQRPLQGTQGLSQTLPDLLFSSHFSCSGLRPLLFSCHSCSSLFAFFLEHLVHRGSLCREGAVSCSLPRTAAPAFSPPAQQPLGSLCACLLQMLIASSHHSILFWFLKINCFRYNLQTRKHPFQLCRLMSFDKCVNKHRRPDVGCSQHLNRLPCGPA